MKITRSQLKQIIREELKNSIKEVQAGGGFSNKELLEKSKNVSAQIEAITFKIADGRATPQDEQTLKKLLNTQNLILRKMFQGSAGAAPTGVVDTPGTQPLKGLGQ